jgi:hypothetical protein
MTTTPAPSQSLPWWWKNFVVAFFCLIAIVLGSLDHFFAADRWTVTVDMLLILGGLTSGGVTVGHAWGLTQDPPK